MTFKDFWRKLAIPQIPLSSPQWDVMHDVAKKAFNAGRVSQRKESRERGHK